MEQMPVVQLSRLAEAQRPAQYCRAGQVEFVCLFDNSEYSGPIFQRSETLVKMRNKTASWGTSMEYSPRAAPVHPFAGRSVDRVPSSLGNQGDRILAAAEGWATLR